ncbi:hypothetical protein GCM10010995_27810 [Cysteiniphilum litorale]|uniref:Resolvase/invertase-type recombinase catalytic domain-containing protein n=2 Tax=Fastidiosibacteraceae TaxID=2056687 RepID=A0A8J3EAE6_9GAMM|nr:hypothetical protein GCM10010995_27810 [Cysteiniphilum litorale]
MTHLTNKETVAYLRVSTQDQDLEKNKMDILLFSNEKNLGQVKFVEDKASGTISWQKRALASVIESLSEGDNLIVSEFSRLGRSMLEGRIRNLWVF